MAKVKEIRKIESNIKEVKKEKIESLDDEFDEDFEEINGDNFILVNGVRRFNKTSTLDTNDVPANQTEIRGRRISKEDEREMNFRASYDGGGSPYQNKAYTSPGSMESNASMETNRSLGRREFENNNDLRNPQDMQQNQSGEIRSDKAYAGDNEQKRERDRRRNM